MKELKNFRAFLNEANPDGTVSQGEEGLAQAVIDQFTRQLMIEMNKAIKALEKIGGSFRSPGYKLDLYKAVDSIVNQFKPSYLAEGHSLSDSDIDYLEDFINRKSNEDNIILQRIIKNIIKTNVKEEFKYIPPPDTDDDDIEIDPDVEFKVDLKHLIDKHMIKEFIGGELEKRSNEYFEKLVPGMGSADTIEGEMLRAINRIAYRFYNDGDYYYKGYGAETAGPAHSFLVNSKEIPFKLQSVLKSIFNKIMSSPAVDEEKTYEDAIKLMFGEILDYIDSKEGNYTESKENMFNYESEYEDEEDYDDEFDDDDYYDDDDY